MTAFLMGLALAAFLALATVLGVNLFERSSSEAFYTRNTVPLDYAVPLDGRLDRHR